MSATLRRLRPSAVWAAAGLMLPLLGVFVLSVAVVAGWVRGTDPFWDTSPLTLSEAAMVRDHAEVARLIRAGADPNRAWPVRGGLSDSHRPESVTPLEAAVGIRRLALVELLMREGARLDDAGRTALVTRARAVHADDIAAYLERQAGIP